MRYFLDTEFCEDGKTIDLISIGIVAEDGREFYAVSNDFNPHECNDWVKEHVLPVLNNEGANDRPMLRLSNKEIAEHIVRFTQYEADSSKPAFYAYFADYDWVVLCQLFGTMMNLPKTFPMYCRDLKQIMYHLGLHKDDMPKQEGTEHNALADARWVKRAFTFIDAGLATGNIKSSVRL